MLRRRLLAAVLTISAVLATVTVPAAPAAAASSTNALRLHWTYTNSDKPNASYFDANLDTPIGRWRQGDGDWAISRSYFTYDISRYRGQVVHAAGFRTPESRVDDCAKSAPVELWVTDPISSATTWRNPPAAHGRVGTLTMGGPDRECPYAYHSFDVATAIRAAIDAGQSQITFEVRIAADVERERGLARWIRQGGTSLSVTANTPPAAPTGLAATSVGCGTAETAGYVSGNPRLWAEFQDADGTQDRIEATFAWWPVDGEAARQEYTTTGWPVGTIVYDLSRNQPLPEGFYAWAARSSDGTDTSDWSRTCYFRIDRQRPARPVVTSTDYPDDGEFHGGPGVPGDFRLDPAGSADVVAYRWGFADPPTTEIPAPQPGTPVTLRVAPPMSLTNSLYVQSVDRAGNTSEAVTYDFYVRSAGPDLTVESGGVGLPSRLLMSPGVPGVTEYRYRVGDGPELSVPAGPDGTATAEVIFTAVGWTELTVANYTAAGLAGVWSESFPVRDLPKVTSPGHDAGGHYAAVGQPIEFTFAPRRLGVVRYEYQLDWNEPIRSVAAGSDGTAKLSWTPEAAGAPTLAVRSVQADGTYSEWAYETVWVD